MRSGFCGWLGGISLSKGFGWKAPKLCGRSPADWDGLAKGGKAELPAGVKGDVEFCGIVDP